MRITCKRCGLGIALPEETQTGDVIRCGQCGKKIRIKLRAARRRVHVPEESAIPEPAPRRRSWALRLLALAVIGGVGFAVWRNGPPDLAAIKQADDREIAESGLVPAGDLVAENAAGEANVAAASGLGIGVKETASPAATPIAATTPPPTAPVAQQSATVGQQTITNRGAVTPSTTLATTQPAAIQPAPQNAIQVPTVATTPGAVSSTAPPVLEPVQALAPEDFLHDYTKANGDPLVYAHFREVTSNGDLRVTLVPRQWSLAGEGSDTEYPAFSGTFWVFYEKPGTPQMVRIGDVQLPDVLLNYVDYPRDAFSEQDRAYLAHLEQLAEYAYVSKGRVRYFTLPWDVISVEDQKYVYRLISYLTPTPPAGSPSPLSSAAAGNAPPTITEPIPNGPPPSASVPNEDPAGPPDLPGVEPAVQAPAPPAASSAPPGKQFGY